MSVPMAREPVCVAERGHRARGAGAPEEPAGSLQKLSTHTATQWLLACATVPLPCLQRGTLQKCLRTSGEASRVLRRALSSSPLSDSARSWGRVITVLSTFIATLEDPYTHYRVYQKRYAQLNFWELQIIHYPACLRTWQAPQLSRDHITTQLSFETATALPLCA